MVLRGRKGAVNWEIENACLFSYKIDIVKLYCDILLRGRHTKSFQRWNSFSLTSERLIDIETTFKRRYLSTGFFTIYELWWKEWIVSKLKDVPFICDPLTKDVKIHSGKLSFNQYGIYIDVRYVFFCFQKIFLRMNKKYILRVKENIPYRLKISGVDIHLYPLKLRIKPWARILNDLRWSAYWNRDPKKI